MAIKHIVWQMDDVEAIVTRGLNVIGPNLAAIYTTSNYLVGDLNYDEVYYKGIPVTGYTFLLISRTDGSAVTSGSVTAKITQDGGSQASVSASAVHEGNGQWSINFSLAEMDADVVALAFIHSSAIPVYVTIHTK